MIGSDNLVLLEVADGLQKRRPASRTLNLLFSVPKLIVGLQISPESGTENYESEVGRICRQFVLGGLLPAVYFCEESILMAAPAKIVFFIPPGVHMLDLSGPLQAFWEAGQLTGQYFAGDAERGIRGSAVDGGGFEERYKKLSLI